MSVLLQGVVLPSLQPHLGVPLPVLYGLALWAAGCLLYDLLCLWLAPLTQPRWLAGITLANALYCVLAAVLVVVHLPQLTTLGVAYFLIELVVIGVIVAVELRLVRALHRAR